MKIVLFQTGFIDPATAFAERAKEKLLKNLVVVTKDAAFIKKYSGRLHTINYQDVKPEPGLSGAIATRSIVEQLIPELEEELKKCGDVLYICGCEPIEMAGLSIVQDICKEKKYGFHGFFVAPFNFQGKKQAERMYSMLNYVQDNYRSVSLYYGDELLDLEKAESERREALGIDESEPPRAMEEIYSMRNAYDVLERNIVSTVDEMYKQIPKLSKIMQYTFDFRTGQFSLALDPLGLILSMWHGVSANGELFYNHKIGTMVTSGDAAGATDGSESAEEADGSASSAEKLKSLDTSKLQKIVGILNPERKKEKTESAYRTIERNTIPISDYERQMSGSKLDALVGKIKDIIYNDNNDIDPAVREKMQERLQKEINKFQERQEQAIIEHDGNPPTDIRDTAQAVASIYMDNDDAVLLKEQKPVPEKPLMQTPYQRAARAARNMEKAEPWARTSGGTRRTQTGASAQGEQGEHVIILDSRDAGGMAGGAPLGVQDGAPEQAPQGQDSEATLHSQGASVEMRSEEEGLAGSFGETRGHAGAVAYGTDAQETAARDDAAEGDAASRRKDMEDIAASMKRMSAEEAKRGGMMDFTYKAGASVPYTDEPQQEQQTQPEERDNAIYVIKAENIDYKSERAKRKAEKQATRLSKRLAKAEEKAAIAAVKAEHAAKQVEIISRESKRDK